MKREIMPARVGFFGEDNGGLLVTVLWMPVLTATRDPQFGQNMDSASTILVPHREHTFPVAGATRVPNA